MGIGDNATHAEVPTKLNSMHNEKNYGVVSIRSGGEHFVAIDGKSVEWPH